MAGQDRVCGPRKHPTLDGCPNTTSPSSRKAPDPRAGNRLLKLKSGITRGQLGVSGNKVGQAWEKPAGPRLYRTKHGDGGLNKDGSGHQQLPERLNRQKSQAGKPGKRLASWACVSAFPPLSSCFTLVMCRAGSSSIVVDVKTAS